jgi:hypothetical protein
MTLFQTAQRTQAKLRLAIDGPSGSGKTYSALLIAKGLTGGDLSKVALIDTERGSGSLYADLGPYAVLDFEPPYSVARYIKAIGAAEEEGFEVIVIDSLTHAWSGEGGILDFVDSVAKAKSSGNSFAAWKEGTPLQKKLFDAMLASKCHVIATMRSKVEYVIEENDRGKKVPKKVGLAPEQRKDAEYEFTLVLDLSREHIASASKDRTGLFDDRLEVPSEKTGKELAAWLAGASPEPPRPVRQVMRDEQEDRAEEPQGNGHITKTQARDLHERLLAKGRESKWFLSVLAGKGIGDGEHLTSIPSSEFDGLLEIIGGFADPEGVKPRADAPVRAQDFEEAAGDAGRAPGGALATGEGQEAPEGDDDLDEADRAFLDQTAGNGKKAAVPEDDKPRKKGTVTAAQLTRLGAQCAELERLGVGRDEWRLYMFEKEKVASRTELTKTAATRVIDYLQRWITDVSTGVEAPGGRAA